MNQSKLFDWFARAIFIVSILCIVGVSCPHRPGAVITDDPVAFYAPAIQNEFVTDWHSALYLQECIFLKNVLYCLGMQLSAMDILYVVWYISALIIVLLSCILAFSLKDKVYNFNVVLILSSVLFLANARNVICFLTLDFHFIAVLLSILFSFLLTLKYQGRRKALIGCVVLFFFLLYQMIEVRKNSIILLPFLFFIESYIIWPRGRKLWMLGSSLLFSVLFAISTIMLSKTLFVDQKTYPASMMMLSDMCIAASLRGEANENREKIIAETGFKVKPNAEFYHAGVPYTMGFPSEYTESNWISLRELYISEWKQNFESMWDAKMIQIMDFYLMGYIPNAISNYYEDKYRIGNKIKASAPVRKPSGIRDVIINLVSACSWFLLMLISLIYTCILIIKFCRNQLKVWEKKVLVVALSGILYIVSFLPVTPTPNDRYRAPFILIMCYVVPIAMVNFLGLRQKK